MTTQTTAAPPTFSLLDHPWIPCVLTGESTTRDLTLLEVFEQAPGILEVSDPSPVVTAALHRFLLAILHRCFGPADDVAWAAIWNTGAFDTDALRSYLEPKRNRFDLFHPETPFYQVARLPREAAGSVARLTHELSAGNNPTLFDHSSDEEPPALTSAAATRALIATQAFALGGLVSTEKGQTQHKAANAAPLVKGAVLLTAGENLFQTLVLNLHRLDGANGQPFKFDPAGDRPAWEREEPVRPEDRAPDGYLDLLTWQSRRILLIPGGGPDPLVRRAVLMKGNQFPASVMPRDYETMVAFRKNERATASQDPWPAVGFRQDRALWRDSAAILQSNSDHARPRTLDWLLLLQRVGVLPGDATFPLDAYGLCSDRAKVFFWRHERVPLPLAYLRNPEMAGRLRQAVALAEHASTLLTRRFVPRGRDRPAVPSPMFIMASLLLAPPSDGLNARKPDAAVVAGLVSSLGAERRFWPLLDAPFRTLMQELATGFAADSGQAAFREWADSLDRALNSAFGSTVRSLGASTRELRAVADAERRFNWLRNEILGEYLSEAASHATTQIAQTKGESQ